MLLGVPWDKEKNINTTVETESSVHRPGIEIVKELHIFWLLRFPWNHIKLHLCHYVTDLNRCFVIHSRHNLLSSRNKHWTARIQNISIVELQHADDISLSQRAISLHLVQLFRCRHIRPPTSYKLPFARSEYQHDDRENEGNYCHDVLTGIFE